jgi:hypothetical protein
MLRVVLSIKSGRISASTILRRLGTYSRKNRLYQAFCELGRVIRTGFLLRYISDSQLRSTIQGATNKSEALNRFLKWTFFGGESVISENSRDEQRKTIKYNHLLANCLIFHNLCSLTRLVQHLEQRNNGEKPCRKTPSPPSVRTLPSTSTASATTPSTSAENRLNPTTATPSDGLDQWHETKWPILYRIVAIPPLRCSRLHKDRAQGSSRVRIGNAAPAVFRSSSKG